MDRDFELNMLRNRLHQIGCRGYHGSGYEYAPKTEYISTEDSRIRSLEREVADLQRGRTIKELDDLKLTAGVKAQVLRLLDL
jgi:hypothetical protein